MFNKLFILMPRRKMKNLTVSSVINEKYFNQFVFKICYANRVLNDD